MRNLYHYRLELAAMRAMEAQRAREASANTRGGVRGLPPALSRAGEVAALTEEVKRLEVELAAAKKAAGAGAGERIGAGGDVDVPPATPAEAAAAAVAAAAEAAAEAAAANTDGASSSSSFSAGESLLTRSARGFLAAVSGEPTHTLDSLKSQVGLYKLNPAS
jgi:hypothetical protein